MEKHLLCVNVSKPFGDKIAAFEALLQLALPSKRIEGPITPAGNVTVYKANGMLAYAVILVTYIGLWWFGIFNPAIVYDHLGEIYSALIFRSLFFCVLLYKSEVYALKWAQQLISCQYPRLLIQYMLHVSNFLSLSIRVMLLHLLPTLDHLGIISGQYKFILQLLWVIFHGI
ncbi:hypothetical protein C5167_022016 [Papaver somniferum]|uniref:Uncharacterized protein n=1 Tax=Papaver somniferum TaxID=3469 RepID=A0A4Y7JKG5_PAPSO|nr:hypothetical protein C5167_022016 [Papaver somniferum]